VIGFRIVLKSDSEENAAACRWLGYAYLQKQDFTQAAEYFKQAFGAGLVRIRGFTLQRVLLTRENGFSVGADPALP